MTPAPSQQSLSWADQHREAGELFKGPRVQKTLARHTGSCMPMGLSVQHRRNHCRGGSNTIICCFGAGRPSRSPNLSCSAHIMNCGGVVMRCDVALLVYAVRIRSCSSCLSFKRATCLIFQLRRMLSSIDGPYNIRITCVADHVDVIYTRTRCPDHLGTHFQSQFVTHSTWEE